MKDSSQNLTTNISVLQDLEKDEGIQCENSRVTCGAHLESSTIEILDFTNITNSLSNINNFYDVLSKSLVSDTSELNHRLKELKLAKSDVLDDITASQKLASSPNIPFLKPATSSKIYSWAVPTLIISNMIFITIIFFRIFIKILRKLRNKICCIKKSKYKESAEENIALSS